MPSPPNISNLAFEEQLYEDFLRVRFPQGLQLQPPNARDGSARAAAMKKKYDEEVKVLGRSDPTEPPPADPARDPFLGIGRRARPSPKGKTKHADIDRILYGGR